MDDEVEAKKCWKLRKYAFKLCQDRGYQVSQAELNQTLEEFVQQFGDKPSEGRPSRSDLDLRVSNVRDETVTDQMFVFFPNEPKINIKVIKGYLQQMESEGVFKGIIVVQSGITPPAKQGLTAMAPRFVLEMFTESEILVNITEHKLVPNHVLLTPQEKLELLAKHKLVEKQLPRLKSTDPVAKYYGLKRGEVVRIIRRGETAGEYVTYRIVE